MKEPQCAHPPPLDNDDVIGSNQFLSLSKAELNTKNSWLSFWCSTRFTRKKVSHLTGETVYSIYMKRSGSAGAEKPCNQSVLKMVVTRRTAGGDGGDGGRRMNRFSTREKVVQN